jgi:hypothetical protein
MFRVLHARMDDHGFTCQQRVFWFFWKTVGCRASYKYLSDRQTTYEENTHSAYSTQENAERRMDYEVQKYREDLEHRRKLRAFKPKVVKEWP